MTEIWGILTNWLALAASLATVYFVFKIISIPLWESEISFWAQIGVSWRAFRQDPNCSFYSRCFFIPYARNFSLFYATIAYWLGKCNENARRRFDKRGWERNPNMDRRYMVFIVWPGGKD